MFSWMYGNFGIWAHLAMVNSLWTPDHIQKLWKIPNRTKRVYAPGDTPGLQEFPEIPAEPPIFISVAQFLPEKAHPFELEAFLVAIRELDEKLPRPKLQFADSCLNRADEEMLKKLQDKAIELKLDGDVEFHKNVAHRDLMRLLGGASAGLHSMIDEHLGISVVEYMVSGAILIAHNSAGPKMDILVVGDWEQVGFLCQSMQMPFVEVVRLPASERLKMAATARRRCCRF